MQEINGIVYDGNVFWQPPSSNKIEHFTAFEDSCFTCRITCYSSYAYQQPRQQPWLRSLKSWEGQKKW